MELKENNAREYWTIGQGGWTNIFKFAFGIWSLIILMSGIYEYSATNGKVVGSNFGMLISLVHIGGEILIWLALLSFYIIAEMAEKD